MTKPLYVTHHENIMIQVLINGAKGKMGQESVKAVSESSEFNLSVAADIEDDLDTLLKNNTVDVVLDFTHPTCVASNIETCLKAGKPVVVGTTGLSDADLENYDILAKKNKVSCLVIPNFSIGAVLMMQFSAKAAQYLPHYEIIEYHHPQKADAPSGTAIKTAQLMKEAQSEANPDLSTLKETELHPGARGAVVAGAALHSVRLPGFMADQEVVFGASGQRLSLHHISTDRACYMPGVLLALKETKKRSDANQDGLLYGLESLL